MIGYSLKTVKTLLKDKECDAELVKANTVKEADQIFLKHAKKHGLNIGKVKPFFARAVFRFSGVLKETLTTISAIAIWGAICAWLLTLVGILDYALTVLTEARACIVDLFNCFRRKKH